MPLYRSTVQTVELTDFLPSCNDRPMIDFEEWCRYRHVQEAKTMPWGQAIGYVSDPDGFLLERCMRMG
jgi:hypothetical protein